MSTTERFVRRDFTSGFPVTKPIPSYLKIHTEDTPAVVRPEVENFRSLAGLCLAFEGATGWPLRYVPGEPSADETDLMVQVKPQFEAGREAVGKGGVVRNPDVHRHVLEDVLGAAQAEGYTVRGIVPSPLKGPAGNVRLG